MMQPLERRGSVPSPRHGHCGTDPIPVTVPPARCVTGRSKRAASQTPPRRKLTPQQEATIRALARTKSLRSLAADFGVSHEAVRRVIRHAKAHAA